MEQTQNESKLNSEEIARYARHISLPEIGIKGQEKLKTSSVACIGTGGLGSPLLIYLAAAGIGRIGIVDFDVVEYSNLQRQIIHTTNSIGLLKTDSAKEHIIKLNTLTCPSNLAIEPYIFGLLSIRQASLIR